MESLPVFPPLSVTCAEMTWAPVDNELTLMDGPVPISTLSEVHWMPDDTSPSSRSSALAANWICSPGENTAPFTGDVMATPGGALTTTETDAVDVLPPVSVTDAVIVCVPLLSALVVTKGPEPRTPSMFELHWMPDDRSPSSRSVAVPVNVTGRSGAEIVPSGGAVMFTTGAALTVTAMDDVTVLPPVSVTEAVITCPPSDNEVALTDAPVPRSPSWLELH